MTLWRQVYITVIVLLSVVFIGTFIISTHTMHRYLINQMSSHAQDTATALGVAISKDFSTGDMVTVNRTIDAVFDRGYYKRINLQNIKKKVLYDNIYKTEDINTPRWFTSLVNIPAAEADAEVLSGWLNAGNVQVTSNPDYGYFELWRICSYNFWWFLGCGALAVAGALFVLHKLLRPLHCIIDQAEAIVHRNFLIQDTLPVTKEFRVVVETMNKMSINLKEMFFRQVEFSAAMRERSYKEMLTGLGNKNFFMLQLEHMLSSNKNNVSNGIFLFKLTGLDIYRSKFGAQATEIVLKNVAAILTTLQDEYNVLVLSHFGNHDFALIIINIEHAEAEVVANKMLAIQELTKAEIAANVAGIVFVHDGTVNSLLEQTENILLEVQKLGVNKTLIKDYVQEKPTAVVENWGDFLQHTIADKDVMFHYQPVFGYNDEVVTSFHNEALLRLKGPNREVLPSGLVIPMVEKFKLGAKFDRVVIKAVIERIEETPYGSQRYGVNISRAALQDKDFILWLSDCCARAGIMQSGEQQASASQASGGSGRVHRKTTSAELTQPVAGVQRLQIELAENLVRDHFAAVKDFFACMKIYGVKVGIDHFGRGFSSFEYLNTLDLDYIKIDGSYSRGIDTSAEQQMIMRSFVEMGHGLGLTVIATSVETEAEYNVLLKLHVDGMQGYFISPPA